MEVSPGYMGYDRTIVVFSPDGRLFQVEYAREAVKRGTTSVGIKTKDGIVLAAFKPIDSLSEDDSYEKIYEIDEHIGATSAGLLSDARVIVSYARTRAQVNRVTFEEPIDIQSLVRFISDRIHVSTLYAGLRPYGIGLLIAGEDSTGLKLFETDPSGTIIEWKARVIGRGTAQGEKLLKRKYNGNLKLEQGIRLAIEILKKAEKDVTPKSVEIGAVENGKFHKLSFERIKKYM